MNADILIKVDFSFPTYATNIADECRQIGDNSLVDSALNTTTNNADVEYFERKIMPSVLFDEELDEFLASAKLCKNVISINSNSEFINGN